ncbi:MAG: hypothetical protein ACHQ2F_13650 [Desulfobaccales bacterium]
MKPRTGRKIALALALTLTAVLLFPAGCATTGTIQFKTVTVDEILQMSKDKVPDEQIIKKIAESGTIYRLSASQLANLRQAGVSDQVINYMQMTYLDAVRREQSREDLRYWNPSGGYWYGGVPYGWW